MIRFLFILILLNPFLIYSQEEAVYGKIKVEKKDLKIYSQAYIHYPQVFRDFDRGAQFDTTSFEERFLDTTYANTIKIDPNYRESGVYETLALDFYGEINGELWFVFKKNDGYAASLTRKNSEVNAFTGMAWVYKGALTQKEFKEQFIYYKRKFFLNRKKRRHWTDFRIYYDNGSQSFVIKLKNIHGFVELQSYPRYKAVSRDVKESQERYEKIYANYLKKLGKRKKKFDKKITKRKQVYYTSIKKYDEELWRTFQKNYMSLEEQKLSRDDWLVYYDKVIANEKKAMGNASPTLGNIVRSIKIDGYTIRALATIINPRADTSNTTIKTLYQNNKQDKLAITDILVIDVEAKTYKKYIGSKGVKTITIDNPDNTNSILIAWLRNGDIGFLNQEEVRKIPINKNGQSLITLNIISRKFASVQTVREELNF